MVIALVSAPHIQTHITTKANSSVRTCNVCYMCDWRHSLGHRTTHGHSFELRNIHGNEGKFVHPFLDSSRLTVFTVLVAMLHRILLSHDHLEGVDRTVPSPRYSQTHPQVDYLLRHGNISLHRCRLLFRHCFPVHSIIGLTFLYSACAIISDFTFAILPIFLVWGLNMPAKTRIMLIPVLGMACV
jgi:hypothetical protein